MAYNFFATDPFNFNTQLALGGIYSGCGDLGEMLATTARIVEGDADIRGPQSPSESRPSPMTARQPVIR